MDQQGRISTLLNQSCCHQTESLCKAKGRKAVYDVQTMNDTHFGKELVFDIH
jgi:hypothetical protein